MFYQRRVSIECRKNKAKPSILLSQSLLLKPSVLQNQSNYQSTFDTLGHQSFTRKNAEDHSRKSHSCARILRRATGDLQKKRKYCKEERLLTEFTRMIDRHLNELRF